MDRRSFLRMTGGAAALSMGFMTPVVRMAGAQTKVGFTALGLPELKITVTDHAYQVSPAKVPAGWTLVTVDNQQKQGGTSADIMAMPAGQTPDGILKSLAAAQAPGAKIPDWLFQTTFAGAPWAPASSTAQSVVRLDAGDWLVFSPLPLTPATFSVTANKAGAAPAIGADVDVTVQEFAFIGLDKPLSAGSQIWKVTNIGHQPHMMVISEVPAGTTQDQLVTSTMALISGQPDPKALPPDKMRDAGGCSSLSHGQSAYLSLDLTPGTYGAVCYVPDQRTGEPHMMIGMSWIFTVK